MASTTRMATATNSSPGVRTPATHQRGIPATHQRGIAAARVRGIAAARVRGIAAARVRGIAAARVRGIPAARLVSVVERSTELSDEVLESVEAGQRAAIEVAGRFLVTVEEALPEEVRGACEVAKGITESGLEMADRLVQTQYDFVRKVIESIGKSLSSRSAARPSAAR
jgi:hypothetical protein